MKKKQPSPSTYLFKTRIVLKGCAATSHCVFSVCLPHFQMLHCVALFIFASAAFCLYAKCVLTGAFCLTVVLLYWSRYCWFSWSWKCVRYLESYTDFFIGKIKVYRIVSYHIVSCCIISCAILLYHIVLYRAMLYPLESYWRNAWLHEFCHCRAIKKSNFPETLSFAKHIENGSVWWRAQKCGYLSQGHSNGGGYL